MILQDKRILYIEDDPRNRKLVEMIVTNAGAKIWFDKWGSPALSMSTVMSHRPLDLILLDLMFPRGFNGYDVYTMLQQNLTLREIPVVIVSAADPSIEMEKSREMGLDGYIAKPIDAVTFPTHLHRIINGDRLWIA